MKLGVLGDIHSCAVGLEACVARLLEDGAEGFLLLGDYVTNCENPEAVMGQIRALQAEYPCWAVRGNREESLLRWKAGKEQAWKRCSQSGCMLYTAERLSEESFRWIGELPLTLRVELPGCKPLRLCHGSPGHSRGKLFPDYRACRDALATLDAPYLICGHTHQQGIFRAEGRALLNPGAVHYRNLAQCALVERAGVGWEAKLLTIGYDAENAAESLLASELRDYAPAWAAVVAEELRSGGDLLRPFIDTAFALVRQRELPADDESCWQDAARQLGVEI